MTCTVCSQDARNGRNCGYSDYEHGVRRRTAAVAAGLWAGSSAAGATTATAVFSDRRDRRGGDDRADGRAAHHHHHHHLHDGRHCYHHHYLRRHHDPCEPVVMFTPDGGRCRRHAVTAPSRWHTCVALLYFVLAVLSSVLPAAGDAYACGTPADRPLVGPKGVITTPAFPGPFPVPIECEWVIQADAPDTMIEVYFTQLYVTDGLVITEYLQYPPTFGFLQAGREVFNKSHISQYGQSMLTTLPYLVIRFRLDRLEGNHIRVHDDLMDVYGFNVTYEMRPVGDEREDVCSLYKCSYSGNCLGNANLT